MFHDREEAARQLATKLRDYPLQDPLVLGIPRGGVVTGTVLAREIGAEFDVVLSRKLRAPDQPELAIGAIAENGDVYVNDDEVDAYFHREKELQLAVIATHKARIRGIWPQASIQKRSVIVTDDGIATGSTMVAALQSVRSQEPAELIAAVPVAPADRIKELEKYCDKVVCLVPARHFWAVGQFYAEFPTVDDDQVIEILRSLRGKRPSDGPAEQSFPI